MIDSWRAVSQLKRGLKNVTVPGQIASLLRSQAEAVGFLGMCQFDHDCQIKQQPEECRRHHLIPQLDQPASTLRSAQ